MPAVDVPGWLDGLFLFANASVMPFWLLMLFAPGWPRTRRIIASPWIVIAPVALYTVAIVPLIPGLFADIARPDLAKLVTLFAAPEAVYVAWLHFLAFDLFVGRWAYLEARRRGTPAWVSSPILFCCLMFGPLGCGLWLLARTRWPDPSAQGGG